MSFFAKARSTPMTTGPDGVKIEARSGARLDIAEKRYEVAHGRQHGPFVTIKAFDGEDAYLRHMPRFGVVLELDQARELAHAILQITDGGSNDTKH